MFKIITEAADITKAIASIKARGAKLDADIHQAGVSVLAHAAAHGDTTLCDKLVHAMPKGARKLALVEWMLAYGTIAKLDPKQDKAAIADGRLFKLDKTRSLQQDEAIAKPWADFKPEPDVLTAFDAGAAVAAVLKRLNKATTDKLNIKNKAEALREAEALVKALQV